MVCVCTHTGEWGKDDAVLQVDVAHADRGEECEARRHGDLLKTRYGMFEILVLTGETAIRIVCFIASLNWIDLSGWVYVDASPILDAPPAMASASLEKRDMLISWLTDNDSKQRWWKN
jgi:hypothetical protein